MKKLEENESDATPL